LSAVVQIEVVRDARKRVIAAVCMGVYEARNNDLTRGIDRACGSETFRKIAFARRQRSCFRNRDSPVLDYAPILVHRDDRAAYDKKIHIDRDTLRVTSRD